MKKRKRRKGRIHKFDARDDTMESSEELNPSSFGYQFRYIGQWDQNHFSTGSVRMATTHGRKFCNALGLNEDVDEWANNYDPKQ